MIDFFEEEDNWRPEWSEQGSLLNPKYTFTLYHGEALRGNYNPYLNEVILFALAAYEIEGKWYGGFYYNPIPSEENEDSDHFYPVNSHFSPGFESRDKALVWAMETFMTMYSNIHFKFKLFIFSKLLAFCQDKEWLMVTDEIVVTEVINEAFAAQLLKAKLTLDPIEKKFAEAWNELGRYL
jgi:hypothetical protein